MTAKKVMHCTALCIGKLEVTNRPTKRLTNQPTDIATHRAAIAAKNHWVF